MHPTPRLVELLRHRPVGLSGLVAGVVGLREHAGGLVERRQPAGSLTLLRLSLGDRLTITQLSAGEGDGRSYASFVAGFMPGYATTRYVGHQDCIQIYLTPRGVARILGVPAGELGGRVVDLYDVAPDLGDQLLDQLAAEPDWSARFARVDRLLHRLAARRPETDAVAERLWQHILATGGTVRIAELVQQSGWSHRRFVTRMREHVGVSPKSAASVVRFERALNEAGRADGLAGLALHCGYADQSHLTRDFARFAGASPGTLRNHPVPTAWTALGGRDEVDPCMTLGSASRR